MFGQFEFDWPLCDWLGAVGVVVVAVPLEVEPLEEEPPVAALAITALPPPITASAATVARPIRSLCMVVHLLSHRIAFGSHRMGRVNRPRLRGT
jgi:hypothetical protein